MSAASMVATVFKSIPQLSIVVLNLVWMYATLGSKVHKTRRAFEKQLIQEGMSKQDAQRLSVCFQELKDNITGTIKETISGNMRFQTK